GERGLCRRLRELRTISFPEFRPLLGVMPEPCAQGGGGRDVAQPEVDVRVGLAYAARPQAVDEDAHAVSVASAARGGRGVDPFQGYVHVASREPSTPVDAGAL